MDISKQKFLVADDSAMMRDTIEGALKSLGANRVDKVENGKDALLKIKKACTESFPYALVTLDWEMPELSGPEVLKALRADALMKTQRVLMVSSKSGVEDLRELAALQPNGYLVKPFTNEVLAARVKKILDT